MAHSQERTDKNCLNCGTTVEDRFCPHCGQENLEPKETVGHLFLHFFEDLTHFDGKFLNTIKTLLTRPGFLTEEYIKGRRATYLHPIRMYFFISATFFFILMTFFIGGSSSLFDSDVKASNIAQKDSTASIAPHLRITTKSKMTVNLAFNVGTDRKRSVREYDSAQKILPISERDDAIYRYINRRWYAVMEYMYAHPDDYQDKIAEKFGHSFPQMLFIALPVFALLLQILYFRRKQFNYVSHAIFSVHYYCVSFIAFFLIMCVNRMGFFGKYIGVAILLLLLYYLFRAMKRFYKQGGFKTFTKFLLLNLSMSLVMFVLVSAFLANSLLSLANLR